MVVAKAYADWVTRSPELKGASQFINDPPALYAAGIEPVYVPTRLPQGGASVLGARTTRVKNSVDVKMTADCIECAHSYPNIGIYVLVSGDSDFIHVINSLRAIGKRAIIIGVSWSTSRRLADQVDGLILYDTDVDPETHPEPAPLENEGSLRSAGAGNRRQQSQQLSEIMRVVEELVRAERQAGRTPLLTSLKQRIMRRLPGFDEKKLGFSGFKKLMLRTVQEGNIKLVTVGLVDWVLMADEPTPQEALPDALTGSIIESVAAGEEVTSETGREVSAAGEPAPQAEREAGVPSQAEGGPAEPATEETAGAPEEFAPAPLGPALAQALTETLAQANFPDGPGDGLEGHRIRHLIIMTDALEHREGISHVAFNFLIGQIYHNLQEGLDAGHPEIVHCWGNRVFNRTYVTRLIRALGEAEVFVRGVHINRDAETGQTRRRSTFNLQRSHPLVVKALESLWGAAGEPEMAGEATEEQASEETVQAETVGELPSAHGEGREVVEAAAARPVAANTEAGADADNTTAAGAAEATDLTPDPVPAVASEAEPTTPETRRPAPRRGNRQQTGAEAPATAQPDAAPEPETTPETRRPASRRGNRQQTGAEAPAPAQPDAAPEPETTPETRRPASRRGNRQQTAAEAPAPAQPDAAPEPETTPETRRPAPRRGNRQQTGAEVPAPAQPDAAPEPETIPETRRPAPRRGNRQQTGAGEQTPAAPLQPAEEAGVDTGAAEPGTVDASP